jgi:hypothetical protein
VQLGIYNLWLFSFTIFTILFQARLIWHWAIRTPLPTCDHLLMQDPQLVSPQLSPFFGFFQHDCALAACSTAGDVGYDW